MAVGVLLLTNFSDARLGRDAPNPHPAIAHGLLTTAGRAPWTHCSGRRALRVLGCMLVQGQDKQNPSDTPTSMHIN